MGKVDGRTTFSGFTLERTDREPAKPPDAECLLDLARAILYPRRLCILADGGNWGSSQLAEIKLAIELERKPGLCLRALVEGWDRQRLVREMY